MILLTAEERIALDKNEGAAYYRGVEDGSRAQLKKVVEWSGEQCPHTPPSYLRFKCECLECWQALKKEVGG